MIGYKITNQERELLKNMKMLKVSFYNTVLNDSGEWFIFEKEHLESGLGIEAEYIAPKTQNI